MKTLEECKNYYIDVFTDYLVYRDTDTETKLETLKNTLAFIYPNFDNIVLHWNNETLNNFYSHV